MNKDSKTESMLKELLEKSILFQNITQDDLKCVVRATEQKSTNEDEVIIAEGDQGDVLFIVASGEYECWKMINEKNTYLKTYIKGEAFGELALMYNAPRAATIKCTIPGEVFALDRQTFKNIVQEAATKKRSAYSKILSKVEILSDIDLYEKEQLCDALKEEELGANEYVVKEGESGNKFYIIAEGQLIAEKKDEETGEVKTVFSYTAGEYFGEIALIKNTVRQASVKSITPCKIVWIDRSAFKRLLGPIEEILSRNMDKYKKFLEQ